VYPGGLSARESDQRRRELAAPSLRHSRGRGSPGCRGDPRNGDGQRGHPGGDRAGSRGQPATAAPQLGASATQVGLGLRPRRVETKVVRDDRVQDRTDLVRGFLHGRAVDGDVSGVAGTGDGEPARDGRAGRPVTWVRHTACAPTRPSTSSNGRSVSTPSGRSSVLAYDVTTAGVVVEERVHHRPPGIAVHVRADPWQRHVHPGQGRLHDVFGQPPVSGGEHARGPRQPTRDPSTNAENSVSRTDPFISTSPTAGPAVREVLRCRRARPTRPEGVPRARGGDRWWRGRTARAMDGRSP
jgi:hypothetical protein